MTETPDFLALRYRFLAGLGGLGWATSPADPPAGRGRSCPTFNRERLCNAANRGCRRRRGIMIHSEEPPLGDGAGHPAPGCEEDHLDPASPPTASVAQLRIQFGRRGDYLLFGVTREERLASDVTDRTGNQASGWRGHRTWGPRVTSTTDHQEGNRLELWFRVSRLTDVRPKWHGFLKGLPIYWL